MKSKSDQFISIIKDAETALTKSQTHLKSALNEWRKKSTTSLDDLDTLQGLKLALQYRLDTQSVLAHLGQLQSYVLQVLGIEKLHSFEMNIERLAFALGTDDLQQLLHMLNHLVESILRVLAHNQKQQMLDRKKLLERLRLSKELPLFNQSLEQLHRFSHKMQELQLALEETPGAPHPGIIYDHIAALEGPISRFQYALQNGMVLSSSIYQQLELKSHQHNLSDTLQNAHQLIQKINATLEPHRLFTPTRAEMSAERLEERAAVKRFGLYFNR